MPAKESDPGIPYKRTVVVQEQRQVERAGQKKRQNQLSPKQSGLFRGALSRKPPEILWKRIYLYQVQIFGVSHGTRKEAEQLVEWIRSGQLKPVLHGAFRLSELHQAERYFMNRGNDYLGKIVIVPDSQWEEHGKAWSLESGT